MSIRVETMPVTALAQNCRLVIDEENSSVVIVDPGGEGQRIQRKIESLGLKPEAIWLTHSHLDHCGGVADLLSSYNIPLVAHPGESLYRSRVEEIGRMYGLPPGDMKNCPEPTQMVTGGETLKFGGVAFEVRFCPGHSPGHVVFYNARDNFVLGGDTLFAGSIGRTDLPGGNHELLLESIAEQLYSLPDDTDVLPGHGPDTTIGVEKVSNPFVRAL
ncbi:MAG: MBL fold metallo-hydrolase [Bdellovibrionales bacterium]|nr:MBL fold metallo-hydrolase [Bdellovibrionales bacterium]